MHTTIRRSRLRQKRLNFFRRIVLLTSESDVRAALRIPHALEQIDAPCLQESGWKRRWQTWQRWVETADAVAGLVLQSLGRIQPPDGQRLDHYLWPVLFSPNQLHDRWKNKGRQVFEIV